MLNVTKHNASAMTGISKHLSTMTNVSKSSSFYFLLRETGYRIELESGGLIETTVDSLGMRVTNVVKHNG